MGQLVNRINKYFLDRAELWILGLGILLRLKHYLENRSLWLDEACAAVSVASRSYNEILSHYEVMPEFAHPPMVFMLIERSLVDLFGNNEMSLRLFPLLCGIAALLLFFLLTRSILPRGAFLLALALFAVIDPLVYYSAELKQYSTDLAVMIALLFYSEEFIKEKCCWIKAGVLALLGAAVLWLSNAMVFMLASMAAVFLWRAVRRRDWAELLRLGSAFFVWAASFAAVYHLSLGHMVGNDKLKATWEGALFKGSLFSGDALAWLWQVVSESFRNPLGLAWPLAGAVLFVVGVLSLVRNNSARAALLALPIFFALVAGWLGKYPFRGRVLLFLVPCYLVPIAAGVEAIAAKIGNKRSHRAVWAILAIALLAYPLQVAARNFIQGREWVENRPAMEFFRDHYEPGDFVVMNTSAQPPFWYYVGSLGIGVELRREPIGRLDGKTVEGMRVAKFARDMVATKDGHRLVAFRYEYHIFNEKGLFRQMVLRNAREAYFVRDDRAVEGLPAGRVWLVLSQAPEDDDREINGIIRDAFDRRAKRLLSCERMNAAVYLYDMQ